MVTFVKLVVITSKPKDGEYLRTKKRVGHFGDKTVGARCSSSRKEEGGESSKTSWLDRNQRKKETYGKSVVKAKR